MDLAPLFTIPETQAVVNHEVSVDCWSVEVQNKGPVVALFAWVEDARPVVSEGYVTIQQNYLCLFPGESRMINMEWSGVEPERRCVEISGWNFKGATLNAED
jgi:beta-mannosidase